MKKSILLILLLIPPISAQPVSIEYFHQFGCLDCEKTDPIIREIETYYDNMTIQRVDTSTPTGWERWHAYGFLEVPAVVINSETKIPKDQITKENLRPAIAVYFAGSKPDNKFLSTNWSIPLAYSLGLFSGFSPCLMAILGFVLSYTAGTSRNVRNGMIRAMVFGLGLLTAYIIIGVCILVFRKSLTSIGDLSIITGIIVIVIGLNLMGIFKVPFTLDNFFHQSAKKHAGTMAGLFILGLLFSLIKVPCAAPVLFVMLNKILITGTINDLLLLLAFGGGVLTPFLGIGLVGGCTLSEQVRSYRVHIKTISGMVLIVLGVWLMQ